MISLNSSSFVFAFRIEDFNSNIFEDLRYFEVAFEYKYYFTNKEGIVNTDKSVKLKTDKCNSSHLDQNIVDKHKISYIYNYFCADLTDFHLGGSWEPDSYIGVLEYQVIKCSKDTELKYNLKCASTDEISKLDKLYFSYFNYETSVNPTNANNPIEVSYNYKYELISLEKETRNIRLYYSISNLISDNGFIFESRTNQEFVSFDSVVTSTIQKIYNDNIIIHAIMYLNKKNPIYNREYIKVPDIAAEVGGLFSLVYPFIDYFLRIFIDNEYTIYLYYSFFRIKEYEKPYMNQNENIIQNEDGNKINNHEDIELKNISYVKNSDFYNKNKIENLGNSTTNMLEAIQGRKSILGINQNRLKDITKKDVVLNKELDKIIVSKNKKASNIEISYRQRLLFICCCGESKINSNPSYRLINMVETELTKKCDFVQIVKSLDQFRLIKKIILNEGQCLMLNNRDFKILTQDSITNHDKKDIDEDEVIKKEISSYFKLRNEKNLVNQVDTLLLKYLRKELSEGLAI